MCCKLNNRNARSSTLVSVSRFKPQHVQTQHTQKCNRARPRPNSFSQNRENRTRGGLFALFPPAITWSCSFFVANPLILSSVPSPNPAALSLCPAFPHHFVDSISQCPTRQNTQFLSKYTHLNPRTSKYTSNASPCKCRARLRRVNTLHEMPDDNLQWLYALQCKLVMLHRPLKRHINAQNTNQTDKRRGAFVELG